jgi:hypothetical protein
MYARIAGVLFLITLVAGGFGEFYVPSTLIVSGDATATAKNIIASGALFRLGFAGYLVEAMCDIGLNVQEKQSTIVALDEHREHRRSPPPEEYGQGPPEGEEAQGGKVNAG